MRCASCSVIAMGVPPKDYTTLGIWICDVFLDLHQSVLERVLLFESLLQVGQPSLLEEVEEFLAAMLLPGHDSESQPSAALPRR